MMKMKNKTVNIPFRNDLLAAIDDVAKRESRSRSELLRETARMYVERKRWWEDIFACGKAHAEQRGLTEADVAEDIRAY